MIEVKNLVKRYGEDVYKRQGVDRALEHAKDADLILYVVDASVPLDENDAKIMEILKGRKAIVLLNKSDLTAVIEKEEMEQKTGAPVISISAREETGMEELEEQMKKMFFQGEISFNDEVYITNARHKQALSLIHIYSEFHIVGGKFDHVGRCINQNAFQNRHGCFTGDSFHSDTNAFYKVCFVKH